MDKEYSKYFRILELPDGASLYEVKSAYNLLRRLYSTESMITTPIEDECSEEENRRILEELEEAYHKLLELFAARENHRERGPDAPSLGNDIGDPVLDTANPDGPTLKKIREDLNIDLNEISLTTKVAKRHLGNIEMENFRELPTPAYTRGFVLNYVKYLAQYSNIDPYEVTNRYMENFRRWEDSNSNKRD